MAESAPESPTLELGRLIKPWGVRGWVFVYSLADPPQALFDYQPWLIRGTERRVAEWRTHGKRLVARIEGVDSRDDAEAMAGATVTVRESDLPKPPEGHYYWKDLVGLEVEGFAGRPLGRVAELMATGASDVLVVDHGGQQRLIPFVPDRIVEAVDLEAGRIRVAWDPDWDAPESE